MTKPIRKAVLPVAGLGTRVLPGTKMVPKELLNVVDRPILAYTVAEARAAGIEHFVFVTGRGKQAIEDYFDHHVELEAQLAAKGKTDQLDELLAELPRPGEMSFVRQMQPLGLGHAVWCARDVVGDEPFAVLLPDDIVDGETSCLKQLVDAFGQTGGNLVAVEEVPHQETRKYGVIDPAGRDGRLISMKGMVEKPSPDQAPSNLAIIGRYILQPEIFDLLSAQEKGAGGEIQLTDAMASLIGKQPFHGVTFDGRRFDCGSKAGYIEANLALALEREDIGAHIRDFAKAELAN